MLICIHNFNIALAEKDEAIEQRLAQTCKLKQHQLLSWSIVRKAIDARQRHDVHFVCSVECVLLEGAEPELSEQIKVIQQSRLMMHQPDALRLADNKKSVIVVGAGPAGLFAALALAEAGQHVVLLERGKAVEPRMRDIGRLRSRGELNPESNVCFGEGGAGTYTDGKLYTRIKHPYVRWVLAELVRFGAKKDILVDAHPHLGTDRLVRIIKNMRYRLLDLAVDYRFEARVEALLSKQGQVQGVRLSSGEEIQAQHVVLATGHSARDTYEHLQAAGIALEAKDFAVGVRTEHEQDWVNQCQFADAAQHPALGAAEFSLTHQVKDSRLGKRGVFSFCMCPGGLILPSPTEHQHMAINGMSNAKRSSPLANSGVVVQVTPADIQQHGYQEDALMGIRFQRELESKTFQQTQQAYAAPAMRIHDFVAKKNTGKLAFTRFKPAVEVADIQQILPTWLSQPLREGLLAFDRKMPGFVTEHANMLAVESRTSSPVRIVRGKDMQSVNLRGLYPIGEGAGYAGGIVSAAV
ncbi:MAG: NAD(P)/FAD-dependent oxidoreductase, partial [Mariprofundaceae bacterium]|nr:NAD(P)/FAD-dependent oxidoreductase [Mariprofundaceae bacterium]